MVCRRLRLRGSSAHVHNSGSLETLKCEVKLCRSIAVSDHIKEYRGTGLYSGSEAVTDNDFEQYTCGSCHTVNAMADNYGMGASLDCVVDPQLRVQGISSLRVVDFSVRPILPGGQPGAPMMMIAESGRLP